MADYAFPALNRTVPQLEWGIVWNTEEFIAPMNFDSQVVENPGARWQAVMTFPNLAESDAILLQAWLMKLAGRANRALLYNFARQNVLGTITGSPQVNGAGQTGESLTLDNCGNTKTLLTGSFIGVDGRLKYVVADATSDASGNMVVEIRPKIWPGESPTDNSVITLYRPTCRMRLEEDSVRWLTRIPNITDIPLSFVEDPT